MHLRLALQGLVLLLFTQIGLSQSDQTLYPVRKDGQWGYINRSGSLVVTTRFDLADHPYDNGFSPIYQGEQIGLVNSKGAVVIQAVYDNVLATSDGFLILIKDGLYGLSNASGELILDLEYNQLRPLKEGRFLIEKAGYYGVVDPSGKVLIPMTYRNVRMDRSEFLIAELEDGVDVYSIYGELLLHEAYDDVRSLVAEMFGFKIDRRWGILDLKRAVILQPRFKKVEPIDSFYVKLVTDTSKILFDLEKHIAITEIKGDSIVFSQLPGDMVKIWDGKQTGIMNESGQMVLPMRYEDIRFIGRDLFLLAGKSSFGLWNGKMRIEPIFELIQPRDSVLLIRHKSKWGAWHMNGDTILPFEFEFIRATDNVIKAVKNGELLIKDVSAGLQAEARSFKKYRTIKVSGGETQEIEIADNTNDGKAYDGPSRKGPWYRDPVSGLWGLLNKQNEMILAPSFSEVFYHPKAAISAAKIPSTQPRAFEGEGYRLHPTAYYSLVNHENGSLWSSSAYNMIQFDDFATNEAVAAVRQDGKYVMIHKTGAVFNYTVDYIGPYIDNKARFCQGGSYFFSKVRTKEAIGFVQDVFAAQNVYVHEIGTILDAEDSVYVYLAGGEWGYLNERGQKVIEAQYDFVSDFYNGSAIIKADEKWGLIDWEGGILYHLEYDDIRYLENTKKNLLVLERTDNRMGYVDRMGRTIAPPKYKSAVLFSEGKGAVENDGYWGFIDESGEYVIQPIYRSARYFKEGMAGVREKQYYGFINESGELVIPYEYTEVQEFSEGLSCVKKRGLYGYLDKRGKVVIPFELSACSPFEQGVAIVMKSGQAGLINQKGGWVVAPTYSRIDPFNEEGQAMVLKNGDYGYIDRSGNEVVRCQYDYLSPMHDGIAVFRNGKNSGLVNFKGQEKNSAGLIRAEPASEGLIPTYTTLSQWCYLNMSGERSITGRISKAWPFHEGTALIKRSTWQHLIDRNGTHLLDTRDKLEHEFSDGRYVMKQSGLGYYYLNSGGRQVPEQYYQEAHPFSNGRAVVKVNKRFGLINSNGTYVISPKYAFIQDMVGTDIAIVKRKTRMGVVNNKGHVILDETYDRIEYVDEGLFRVERHEEVGYMDDKGQWLWRVQ